MHVYVVWTSVSVVSFTWLDVIAKVGGFASVCKGIDAAVAFLLRKWDQRSPKDHGVPQPTVQEKQGPQLY